MNRFECPDFLTPDLRQLLGGATRLHTTCDGSRTVWHAWGQPSQPAVVLLHGGSGSWTHWVRNIAPLQAAGWRVLVPDLPGFGDSDLPLGCTDVDALPAHLHAGLQQLQVCGACGDRVQLVGFSFGGMAGALWLAAHPQDAEQLVLVGAPGMGLATSQRVPLKGWRHLPTPEAQNQVHRHNLMALMLEWPTSLDDLALSLHAANVQRDRMPRRRLSSTDIVARALPHLQVPVSAIFGEHDALYRERLSELQAAMPGMAQRWGQWHTVAGAGHWVQFEAAQAFDQALQRVLDSVPA
ncbi:MAG: alpha/beta hydrolase [Limnohabitans sp.]|jgi:pimeloyl-ACP methyl ester carboxylesterase|uniref:alpha/beta fold hydrolase n=1 Tax=Limnohabitans sp. TaxID=1907725 RepID=UPI0025D05C53|nr:alpha/beta hydrolase [Limnohabitans sp.]MCO4088778.1 alpha/beta hydrolase [Limnohabitans sp.]